MGLYYITKKEELDILNVLDSCKVIGVDLETMGKNGLIPQQSNIRLLQIGTASDRFVIDLKLLDLPQKIIDLLNDNRITKIFHNAKFDLKHLYHHFGFFPTPVFCTFLASRIISSGNPHHRHSLGAVLERFLDQTIDKTLQQSDWSGKLSDEQIDYAARDVEFLVPLYREMSEQIRQLKMKKISQLEFRTIEPVAKMELKGIHLDQPQWKQLISTYETEMASIEEELSHLLTDDSLLPGFNSINLNSHEQVRRALIKRGYRLTSTSEKELKALQGDDDVITKLLRYRHVSRILKSTLCSFQEAILPETGRVHPNYFQIASASGRFSCSDPNIQQVPREKEIRAAFTPVEGYLYIVADYSQVELRVAAGLSGDPVMLKAYKERQDLHILTAALTTGKAYNEVDKEERQAAKAINFGLIYAMGPKGLQLSAKQSYGVTMTLSQAEEFHARFFNSYSGIQRWHRELEAFAKKRRYIRTASGRIRRYLSDDIHITELFNVPVQGTAAEALKAALCIFYKACIRRNLDAQPVAIIHDEIIVEVLSSQAQETRAVLTAAMIEGANWLVPNIPFEVDATIATSWADKV